MAVGAARVRTGCSKAQPQPGLNGRVLSYPRGKVIGGSSAINAMIYMRGQAADYDGWRQLGLAGWGWDDVLPYFLKHQDHAAPMDRFHQAGGEWRVEHPRMRWPILDAIQDALEAAGIPRRRSSTPTTISAPTGRDRPWMQSCNHSFLTARDPA